MLYFDFVHNKQKLEIKSAWKIAFTPFLTLLIFQLKFQDYVSNITKPNTDTILYMPGYRFLGFKTYLSLNKYL